MASSNMWDATASADGEGIVTVRYGNPHVSAGQHRARDLLSEKLIAVRLGIEGDNRSVGLTLSTARYGPEFVRPTAVDSSFAWLGDRQSWIGVDGAWKGGGVQLLAEIVKMKSGPIASVATGRFKTGKTRLWSTLYHVGSGYAALHGIVNDPRGRSSGMVLGLRYRPVSGTNLVAWGEFSHRIWKGRANLFRDWYLRTELSMRQKIMDRLHGTVRWRRTTKPVELTDVAFVQREVRSEWRMGGVWKVSSWWQWDARLERSDVSYARNRSLTSFTGRLASLRSVIKVANRISLQSGGAIFSVDDWKARLFRYMSSAPGIGYVRGLSGRGWLWDMGSSFKWEMLTLYPSGRRWTSDSSRRWEVNFALELRLR